MNKISLIAILLLLVVACNGVWQIGSSEVANLNFQEDIRDVASQAGARVGVVVPPSSDEVVIQTIIRKAKEHGIELRADQVTVRRTQLGEDSILHLSADYTVPVKLFFVSLSLHFAPASER